MDNSPYAPPQAVVADVIPGPTMIRPWQVRVAVALCWLGTLLTLPEASHEFLLPHEDVEQSVYVGVLLVAYVPLYALFCLLYVLMARGHRWARVVYAALQLLGYLAMFQTVPASFDRGWLYGVLNVLVGLQGVATLWLLFTGAANAWFRTRGGRIEAP
jgi:hypothetical protein